MTKFSGTDATQAIINFLVANSTSLPEVHRNMITETLAGRDLLRTIIVTMETLYSAREETPEGVELMRDLADFVQANNFYGMLERAQSLMVVAERILAGGEAEVEGDPSVSSEYSPAATAQPAVAIPTAPGA